MRIAPGFRVARLLDPTVCWRLDRLVVCAADASFTVIQRR
jgi:hypothetical protein